MRKPVSLMAQLAALDIPGARASHSHLQITETIQAGVMIARVVTVPEAMLAKRQITQRQADAAARYRDDYEMASGASQGGARGSVAAWQRVPATEAQVNALSRLRRADATLGAGRALVVAACVDGAPMRELGRRWGGGMGGRGTAAAGAMLAALLTVLADHYFGAEGERGGKIRGVCVLPLT